MPGIAEKLDFQTATLVEVRQRNDNQLPNSWLRIFSRPIEPLWLHNSQLQLKWPKVNIHNTIYAMRNYDLQ